MAVDKIVGRVGIKALPDTRGFNKSLVKQLEGISQKAVLIPVELEDKSFDRMRDRLEKTAKKMKVKFTAELDDSDLQRELAEIDSEKKIDVEVDADEAKLRRAERQVKDSFDRIELMNRELARQMERDAERGVIFDQKYMDAAEDRFSELVAKLQDEAEVKFETTLDQENIELVKAQMDNLIREYEDRNIPLEAVVENFWASRNLNWITRPRTVEIFAKLNAKSAAATAAAIAALSGGRLAGEIGNDMWTFFRDLDKNLPMLSVASTALINLGGTLFGVTSGLVSFGAGLAHIMPLMLTLPGLAMGTVAAVVAMAVAWRDVKTELASLEAPFTRLGELMSSSYWDEAQEPIERFVLGLMPQMETAFSDASAALGGFTGALATSFGKAFAGGRFESIFESFSEGFRVLEQGTDGFAGAMVNLMQIAGRYWPRLAGWINDTMGRFDQWLTDISTDGRLSDWMEQGITSLYDLWGGLEAGGRILRGLWTAANSAGADAMAGFRAQMEAWDALVNRPSSQAALSDWFEGGRRAAEGLGDAVENIFRPFARNSGLVKETFEASGDAIREFGAVIGNIFGHSSSITGFTSGLNSIEEAFKRIGESSGTLGMFLGTTAEVTGEFARILAGPIGTALDVILPRAETVLRTMLGLSEVMAAAFEDILISPQFRGLADDLVVLADALADIAIALMPLASGVLQSVVNGLDALGPAGIGAIAGAVGLVGGIVTVSNAVKGLAGTFDLLAPAGGKVRGALGSAATFLGGPWGIALAAAGTAVITFAAYVDSTKASVAEMEGMVRSGADAFALWEGAQTILQDFDLGGSSYSWGEGGFELEANLEKIPGYLDLIAERSENAWAALDPANIDLDNSGFTGILRNMDDALSQMPFDAASEGFQMLADVMQLSGEDAERLLAAMPGVEESLIRYANANDIAVFAADGSIDRAKLLAIAYGEIGPASEAAVAGIGSAGEATMTAAERTQAYIDAQNELYNQWAASADANLAWHDSIARSNEALDELSASLPENASALDLNTDAGRRAERILLDTVAAHNRRYDAAKKDGASQEELGRILEEGRAALGRQTEAFGLTRGAASDYQNQLANTPSDLRTAVHLDTSAATRALNNFINKNRVIRVAVDVNGMPSGTIVRPGQIGQYADGGLIPGTPSTSDNTLIHAASGEFIVNTRSTQQYKPMLQAINDGSFNLDDWQANASRGRGGSGSPLVGSLTMVSSGDTRTDLDDVMFRLRSIGRGGR